MSEPKLLLDMTESLGWVIEKVSNRFCSRKSPVAVDAVVGGQGGNGAGSSRQEMRLSLTAENAVKIICNFVANGTTSNLGTETLELRPRLE